MAVIVGGDVNTFSYAVVKASEISDIATTVRPTVVLISYSLTRCSGLKKLVDHLLFLGCQHIALCGDLSKSGEDEIDAILEDTSAGIAVATTEHSDEPSGDVVDFVINSIVLDGSPFRAVCIFDDKDVASTKIANDFERAARRKLQGI